MDTTVRLPSDRSVPDALPRYDCNFPIGPWSNEKRKSESVRPECESSDRDGLSGPQEREESRKGASEILEVGPDHDREAEKRFEDPADGKTAREKADRASEMTESEGSVTKFRDDMTLFGRYARISETDGPAGRLFLERILRDGTAAAELGTGAGERMLRDMARILDEFRKRSRRAREAGKRHGLAHRKPRAKKTTG